MFNQTSQALFQLPEASTFAHKNKGASISKQPAVLNSNKTAQRVTTIHAYATKTAKDSKFSYDQANTVPPKNKQVTPNIEKLINPEKLTKAFDIHAEQPFK